MKKSFFFAFIACAMFLFNSCTVDKAKEAFADGTLSIGSTYEEVIAVLGEPLAREFRGEYHIFSTYVTPLTLDFKNEATFVISYKKGEDGVFRVEKTFTNTLEYTDYMIQVSKEYGYDLWF
jgi:hypothetical protein